MKSPAAWFVVELPVLLWDVVWTCTLCGVVENAVSVAVWVFHDACVVGTTSREGVLFNVEVANVEVAGQPIEVECVVSVECWLVVIVDVVVVYGCDVVEADICVDDDLGIVVVVVVVGVVVIVVADVALFVGGDSDIVVVVVVVVVGVVVIVVVGVALFVGGDSDIVVVVVVVVVVGVVVIVVVGVALFVEGDSDIGVVVVVVAAVGVVVINVADAAIVVVDFDLGVAAWPALCLAVCRSRYNVDNSNGVVCSGDMLEKRGVVL